MLLCPYTYLLRMYYVLLRFDYALLRFTRYKLRKSECHVRTVFLVRTWHGPGIWPYIAVCSTFHYVVIRFTTYIAVLLRFRNVVKRRPRNVTV